MAENVLPTEKEEAELVLAMNDRAQQRAEEEEGYPDEFDVIGQWLVGAVLRGEGEPHLYKKKLQEAMRLFREAKRFQREHRDFKDDLFGAMYEVGL